MGNSRTIKKNPSQETIPEQTEAAGLQAAAWTLEDIASIKHVLAQAGAAIENKQSVPECPAIAFVLRFCGMFDTYLG